MEEEVVFTVGGNEPPGSPPPPLEPPVPPRTSVAANAPVDKPVSSLAGRGGGGYRNPPPPPPPPPRPPPKDATLGVPLIGDNRGGDGGALTDRLATLLDLLGIPTSSSVRCVASSVAKFAVAGLALPVLALVMSWCGDKSCRQYQESRFDVPTAVVGFAATSVSLGCIGLGLAKHGVERFLFAGPGPDERDKRHIKYYEHTIKHFYSLIVWCLAPCFLVKIAREVYRSVCIFDKLHWQAIIVFVAYLMSWTYMNAITIVCCGLFNLECSFQVHRFDDFGKRLEQGHGNAIQYVMEHVELRNNLSEISHRFRLFLLLLFACVTATQFVVLLEITEYSDLINFVNVADLLITCIVQVAGIILCLHAATKISHRAQGIASLASKRHAVVSCESDASVIRMPQSFGTFEHVLSTEFSEYDDDLESSYQGSNSRSFHSSQASSWMSSYEKRQAVVMYMLANPGGITIFGWAIERPLLNTLFFVELSLVTFVLGKTLVLTH